MALKVPTYEPQVRTEKATPLSVPNLPTPPQGAFGGGVDQALKQTGEVVQDIGKKVADHAIEKAREDQEFAIIDADTAYRRRLQDIMFSTEPDDSGKPKGVFNRVGASATGATVDYDNQARGLIDETLNGFQNDYAREKIKQSIEGTYDSYRREVIHHEAAQNIEARKSSLFANLDQQINDAGTLGTNVTALNKAIENAHNTAYQRMLDFGMDPKNQIPDELNKLSEKMVTSAITGALSENPYQAQKTLDGVSSKNLPGDTRAKLQHSIDVAIKQFDIKNKKETDLTHNRNEAAASGKLVNGELTQIYLDQNKDTFSKAFYATASSALKNIGNEPSGTPEQQNNRAIALQKEFVALGDVDQDHKVAATMKYRGNVLASASQVTPDSFKKLLALSDPNFIEKMTPEKLGIFKASLKFIEDHIKGYSNGDASKAIFSFFTKASDADPKDIPALAREAVKPDALNANPALVGHDDLSNNVIGANGINQVTPAQTTLKPDQNIPKPTFKAGDERVKDHVTYVRGSDGIWRPKQKIKTKDE